MPEWYINDIYMLSNNVSVINNPSQIDPGCFGFINSDALEILGGVIVIRTQAKKAQVPPAGCVRPLPRRTRDGHPPQAVDVMTPKEGVETRPPSVEVCPLYGEVIPDAPPHRFPLAHFFRTASSSTRLTADSRRILLALHWSASIVSAVLFFFLC